MQRELPLKRCVLWRFISFCRVMRCKRGLCHHAVSVCLSICLSRSCILSKRINVSENFLPLGSHTILVFLYQTSWQYLNGDPLMGALNAGAGGVGKNRDFWPVTGFIVCCQCCDRPTDVINTVPPDRGKLWHRVCWWRETTTNCLWQEVSMLSWWQQNRI